MNKSKRLLLIAVIVLNFINAASNIGFAIYRLVLGDIMGYSLFSVIYDFISAAAFLTSAGLLIYAIAGKGEFFRARSAYYYAAITITLCLGLVSIPSILLIVTLFMSDMIWVKPHDDVYFGHSENIEQQPKGMSDKEKERKIAELRKLKENGIITDEEFKEKLMELL